MKRFTLSHTLIKAYFDHRNFDSVNQPYKRFTLSHTLIKAYFDHRNFDSVNQPTLMIEKIWEKPPLSCSVCLYNINAMNSEGFYRLLP